MPRNKSNRIQAGGVARTTIPHDNYECPEVTVAYSAMSTLPTSQTTSPNQHVSEGCFAYASNITFRGMSKRRIENVQKCSSTMSNRRMFSITI